MLAQNLEKWIQTINSILLSIPNNLRITEMKNILLIFN